MMPAVKSAFRAAIVVVSIVILLHARGVQAQNLIQNGTFSTPNVGTAWSLFQNGDVPGWTSNNNEIEIDYQAVVMPSFYKNTPGNSLEVNGTSFDSISQTINGLKPGGLYVLSWGYGDRPGGGGNYQLNVSFDGAFVAVNTGTGSGQWTGNSVVVTAARASATLMFAGINAGSNPSYGNEIASVSLVAVPEPGTLVLWGPVLLWLARRRGQARRIANGQRRFFS